MKKYIKPTIKAYEIRTIGMLAASGDTSNMDINDTTVDDVTFGSREDSY